MAWLTTRHRFRDLNPWMLIGWVALGLILLVILLGIVYGFIRLIRSLPARPEKTA